jgi:hypothetical protein
MGLWKNGTMVYEKNGAWHRTNHCYTFFHNQPSNIPLFQHSKRDLPAIARLQARRAGRSELI